MSRSNTTSHRIPRARIDPIRGPEPALAVASLALTVPPCAETLTFLLDDAFRGLGPITVISGTDDPDAVLRIADLMGEVGAFHDAFNDSASGLVIVTVRPHDDLLPDDAERWCRASDLADDHGVILIEWFVLGRSAVSYPRELANEPARWPQPGHVT
jgi:hypothetical protein